MKTNELRLGNMLYYNLFGDNDVVNIRGIGKNCIWLNGNGGAGPISTKYFEPIPLTEEWLEKLGLIKENQTKTLPEELQRPDVDEDGSIFYSWVKGGVFNLETQSSGEIWFELYSHYKHIKCVHELQNLYFALTGEELTIKTEE
jgi:hypothetical protein